MSRILGCEYIRACVEFGIKQKGVVRKGTITAMELQNVDVLLGLIFSVISLTAEPQFKGDAN